MKLMDGKVKTNAPAEKKASWEGDSVTHFTINEGELFFLFG